MSFQEDPKNEFLRLIQENKRKSQQIIQKSSEFLQFGQHMTDLANVSEKVTKNVTSSNIDWKSKIYSWSYANQQQDAILDSIKPISLSVAGTAINAAAYSMADFARPENVVNFVLPDKHDEVRMDATQLSYVIDRLAEKNKVLSLLRQYGLTCATQGEKSPVDLFETAYAAFEQPVNQNYPVATSLIPMRECINATIAALLRCRPKQEPAGSQRDKILSICGQLAWKAISELLIQSLAHNWESLVNELSSSKQRDYTREEWRDCLRRASLFLLEFLQSLDRSKMK